MDKEEVICFDKALDIYVGRRIFLIKNKIFYDDPKHTDSFLREKQFKFDKWNLDNLYDYAYIGNDKENAEKLFAIFLDLKITLVEVFNAQYNFMIINNQILQLALPDVYVYKIEAHDIFVNFVLKYRALWDKIMGSLVFVYFKEAKYKMFLDSKHKKTTFKKFFEDQIVWKKIESYIKDLEDFDNVYRTPEAHQTGKARKEAIFNTGKYTDNEYFKTIIQRYFNPLVEFVNVFGQLLNYAKTQNKYYLDNIVY